MNVIRGGHLSVIIERTSELELTELIVCLKVNVPPDSVTEWVIADPECPDSSSKIVFA